MIIAIVCELVVAGGKLLQALSNNTCKIAFEFRVLRKHHGAPRDKTVYQRLLPHNILGSRGALLILTVDNTIKTQPSKKLRELQGFCGEN